MLNNNQNVNVKLQSVSGTLVKTHIKSYFEIFHQSS